jgi:hypothetical protein
VAPAKRPDKKRWDPVVGRSTPAPRNRVIVPSLAVRSSLFASPVKPDPEITSTRKKKTLEIQLRENIPQQC